MARDFRPEVELAARQHGVVARRQLLAAGLSEEAIDHRQTTGRLHRVHDGIYAVGDARLNLQGRWMAAVLACGDGAALSHHAAAALWEIRPSTRAAVDVTVQDRSGRSRPGIVVHRPRTLTPADVTTHRGIPVTTPARTLVDLATLLTARDLEDALGEAVARGLIDPKQLHTALTDAVLRGRGARRLTATLERSDPRNARTRSKLERAFLKLCREHGLGRPQVNEEIEGEEVDFSWEERRLIVETDGWEFHRTSTSFEADRRRDVRLRAAGWDVRRFSYRQVLDEPELVVSDLRRPAPRA